MRGLCALEGQPLPAHSGVHAYSRSLRSGLRSNVTAAGAVTCARTRANAGSQDRQRSVNEVLKEEMEVTAAPSVFCGCGDGSQRCRGGDTIIV